MTEKERELKGTRIEVHTSKETGKVTKVLLTPEEKTDPWHRKVLDRDRDGIVCPEIWKDMMQISFNVSKVNAKGQRVGKYRDSYITNLPANPKSGQGRESSKYQERIISNIKESQKNVEILAKHKGKEKLVYMCVYLRASRFENGQPDVDNVQKAVLDALKIFIGDDKENTLVIAEKKKLPNYPDADMDFLEQVIVVVTEPAAKVDILNAQK